MHYLIHRDLKANPIIRRTLIWYLVATSLFLAFVPWLEFEGLGLTPATLGNKLQGNPSLFTLPISHLDLATQVHLKLFFNTFLAVVLGAILMRTPWNPKWRRQLGYALFFFPLLEVLALMGAFWYPNTFLLYLKCSAFASLWLTHSALTVALIIYLLAPQKWPHHHG